MADLLYLISFFKPKEEFEEDDLTSVKALKSEDKDFSSSLTNEEKGLDPSYHPHLTMLTAFSLANKEVNTFAKTLDRLLLWFPKKTLVAVGKDMFGSELDIPVTLVEVFDGELDSHCWTLKELHSSVLALVKDFGGEVADEAFSGEAYSPHVSHHSVPREGLLLDSITLVHHQGGFGKQVKRLHTYPLPEATFKESYQSSPNE